MTTKQTIDPFTVEVIKRAIDISRTDNSGPHRLFNFGRVHLADELPGSFARSSSVQSVHPSGAELTRRKLGHLGSNE